MNVNIWNIYLSSAVQIYVSYIYIHLVLTRRPLVLLQLIQDKLQETIIKKIRCIVAALSAKLRNDKCLHYNEYF